MANPSERSIFPDTASDAERCEPQVEDEAVILVEVNAFLKAGGADLQALHAAVIRFVVHCRDRGESVERIISTLKRIVGGAVHGKADARALDAINNHLLGWVLDAYFKREV